MSDVEDVQGNKRKITDNAENSNGIEHPLKKPRVELPEGMSRNQYKKLQRKKAWEDNKEQYREGKKQKQKEKKEKRKAIIQELIAKGEDPSTIYNDTNYHQAKRPKPVEDQNQTGVSVILDCEFDDLMNNKEIVSLSNQITRAYSAKRFALNEVALKISSFNKLIKERFDTAIPQHQKWKKVDFIEEDLKDVLPLDDPKAMENYIYLTADTDECITTLEPGMTYIVGGIVDKNRYKKLCFNKAKELGIKVARLPIDESIKLSGRRVLATSHVYEIMVKWFELKDWGKAFLEVLPPRKLAEAKTEEIAHEEDDEEGDAEKEEEGSDVDENNEEPAEH